MMWRLLKWLRWILYSVLLLAILILSIVSAIVATEPGSRWAVNQAAQRLPLELGEVRGNLITGLDVGLLDYRLEDQSYRVENLSFRWQPLALFYGAVSVQSLKARSVELQLPPPAEEAEPAEPEPPSWPSLALPVRIELGGVDLRNIHIRRGETETRLHGISGTLSLGTFNLRVWDLAVVGPDYEFGLNGRTGLRYPYDSNLNLRWRYTLPDMGGKPMTFQGQAEVKGDLTSVTASHRLLAPATLESELRFWPNLDDLDNSPKLVMDTGWPEQILPPTLFPGEWPAIETGGRLQLEGWLDDYRVELAGGGRAAGIPPLDLSLKGTGDLKHLAVEALTLTLPEGDLAGRGRVQWAPAVEWDLALELNQLNPASAPLEALADWPGSISGRLDTEGALQEQGLRASVKNLVLDGRLRDLALSAAGEVEYEKERLLARSLVVALGANQLILTGSMADTHNIEAYLSAPILEQLDPSLSGSLNAQIEFQGTLAAPRGRVHLEGESLRWQRFGVEQVTLDLERDSGDRYTLSLQSGPWDLAGHPLDEVLVSASGDLEQHEVTAELKTRAWGDIEWSLAGGYVDAVWRGQLSNLVLTPPDPLHWQQQAAAELTLGAGEATLEALCLAPQLRWRRNREAEEAAEGTVLGEGAPAQIASGLVCLEGRWQPETGSRARASISGLPLRLAQRWLQQDVVLLGTLEGSLDFEQTAQAGPSAQLRLETRDGAIEYRYGEEDLEVYPWESTRLEASWQPEQIDARLNTDWGEFGQASATFGLIPQTGALEGNLKARFGQLAPLEALIPHLHEVGGELNANLGLGGRLAQPELSGTLSLEEGSAKLPELGLHLQQVSVSAQIEADRIDLQGKASSGEGELQLAGEVTDYWSNDREARASLDGANFQALNTPELQLLVSPDLSLELNRERILLEGEARIPKARAQLETLPESATRLSHDVVVKDPEGNGDPISRGPQMRIDLTLILGDDVRFEGFGLTSRLSGELQVIQNPERGLLTVGEVGVAEGRYKAYGQDLDIERGRLIFQGPYDNPGLDIRAEREADEYTAGLEIGGTLQRPRSRVYSTPSLPDSEAMAILFTGKPLSSSSSSDASMLVNAIGGLGLERSGFITAEIAETFSLDEFRIQAEDNVVESSLFIGKYITPKLFVRYVVGLFDQTSSVGLRYELTEGLRLEAESGLHQSVDMIYKFER